MTTSSNSPRTLMLQLAQGDNVAVALADLPAGKRIQINGSAVMLLQDVAMGFKVALRPVARGEKIIKYGLSIGSAAADIQPGELVHTHNLHSDYLPTQLLDQKNPFTRID